MKILLAINFFMCTISIQAQTNLYLTDLTALRSILQKTPSYRSQIKGDKLTKFNTLFKHLATDTTNLTTFKYFKNLAQLVYPLKDNHLGLYQVTDNNNFKDKESVDKFISTKDFLNYPKCTINIDSLKIELQSKSTDSIEGIYHCYKLYSVGLFRRGSNEYLGVILDSKFKLWQKGQIAIYLHEYKPNLYKAIYGNPFTKGFILQTNEKYKYQSLINSHFYGYTYTKQLQSIDYTNLAKDSEKFQFKNINDHVQYLLIKTFHANNSTNKQSSNFYDRIKDSLTAPNLILDLRNNAGGAEKETKKYLKLIKKYAKTGNLYVLLNNETVSQAEIFTLKLKKLKNATTIGQPTKGMLTYGNNYGKRERLPSGKFEIYITDMKGKAKHLKYEDIGITPDIPLHNRSDWVNQIVKIITVKESNQLK